MRATFLHSSPSLGFWFIVDLIQTVISCWKAIEAVQNHLNKLPFVATTMNNPQADEAIFNWLINFVFSEVCAPKTRSLSREQQIAYDFNFSVVAMLVGD